MVANSKSNKNKKSPGSTGIKYLVINYRNRWGCLYHVSVTMHGKQLTVWRGNDFNQGEAVAKKVQELMNVSKAAFLDWYDYEREEWLESHGYKNADCERRPNRYM